jgi:hypothetical protein
LLDEGVQGLKPAWFVQAVSARVNSCPLQKLRQLLVTKDANS